MKQQFSNSILTIVDVFDSEITNHGWESISFGNQLAKALCRKHYAAVLGKNAVQLAHEIGSTADVRLIAAVFDNNGLYNSMQYLSAIMDIAGDSENLIVITAHNSRGYDFAPALSVKLNAQCITCVDSVVDNEPLSFVRKAYNGKINMEQKYNSDKTYVISINPGVAKPEFDNTHTEYDIIEIMPKISGKGIKSYAPKQSHGRDTGLDRAQTIIAAGYGIRKKENLDLITRLANLFPNSAVGCSRRIVDAGWMEYGHQIGMTGKTVSPRLYIACGISGASQHIQGMRESGLIVAINTDENASIFSVADIGIREDLTEFLPEFIKTIDH